MSSLHSVRGGSNKPLSTATLTPSTSSEQTLVVHDVTPPPPGEDKLEEARQAARDDEIACDLVAARIKENCHDLMDVHATVIKVVISRFFYLSS